MRSSRVFWSAGCLFLLESGLPAGEKVPPYAGLSATEALKSFHLVPGFRIELMAHEPQVQDPVCLAWDARGRLWVAEMPDYPTGNFGGRIRLLEGGSHDGRYETSKVFAEGLPFPTSVLPYKAGVLVSAAPDIFYLEDTDGDGKADVRRVVLTGFGEGNTQLRVNSLLYGIDHRIYAANGRSGGKVRRPEDSPGSAIDIDQRDVRFDFESFLP